MYIPQTEELIGMFGSRRRNEKREREIQREAQRRVEEAQRRAEELASHRPNLIDAVREVLASSTMITLRPPRHRLSGGRGVCYVCLDRGTASKDAVAALNELQRKLGRHYAYNVYVTGKRPTAATQLRHQLSPGWRTYADEDVMLSSTFDTVADFIRWVNSPNGPHRGDKFRIDIRSTRRVKA